MHSPLAPEQLLERLLIAPDGICDQAPILQIVYPGDMSILPALITRQMQQAGISVVRMAVAGPFEQQLHARVNALHQQDSTPIILLISAQEIHTIREAVRFCSLYSQYRLWILSEQYHRFEGAGAVAVTFPAHVDRGLFRLLSRLVNSSTRNLSEETVMRLFVAATVHHKLSLAQALMLACYPALLGRGVPQFCTTWLTQIVVPDYSLFTLAHTVLAGLSEPFYTLWMVMYPIYPIEFWISFWSDTLWRAYYFITVARSVVATETERIEAARRLPFQFTKSTWRGCNRAALAEVLVQLHAADCASKQGLHIISFELLFDRLLGARDRVNAQIILR